MVGIGGWAGLDLVARVMRVSELSGCACTLWSARKCSELSPWSPACAASRAISSAVRRRSRNKPTPRMAQTSRRWGGSWGLGGGVAMVRGQGLPRAGERYSENSRLENHPNTQSKATTR
jgi:hypothetical protein